MAQQYSKSATAAVSATSVQVIPAVTGELARTQLIITNTSAAAVVTISKGDVAAVAGSGIVLQPKSTYVEATDGGYQCWQGAVSCVADAVGSIAVVESFAPH